MRRWILVLALGCGGSTTPTPKTAALHGACVDPKTDAAKQLAQVENAGDAPQEQPTADLDGDGTPDRVFTAGAAVISNGALYIMRGSCGHFVGDVGGVPKPRATKTAGLPDLEVLDGTGCEGAMCGCEPGLRVFRFDGTA